MSALHEDKPGILAVDDNPGNLLAIETALEGLAASVVRAESGNDALRCLLARDFALVLLDVQMPSLDGFETARLIRQRERNRDTPIIFVTAYGADDRHLLRAYQMGAIDFLFKPIVPEVLYAKASVLLALQRRTREVEAQAGLLREQERLLHEQKLEEERRSWEQAALRRQMEEQARVAAETERRAEELRRTVAEREAAERQLTLINRQLAESDRRKDEFLAVLAHELRNPLAPIVASLGLLDTRLKGHTGPGFEGLDAARRAMKRQVSHLIRLVDDLLDVSRINSGKIELRSEPIELSPVVEQAVATSRGSLDARKHELSIELAEEPIRLMGDSVRLAQVIANLLNNAARYTPPGGRVYLSTCEEEGMAVVRVRDTGHGIPEEMLESIFDTFVQSRSNGEGLGLGLTLVKRLVELHGGSVVARSFGAEQGSEFEVRLPAQRDIEVSAISSAASERPVAAGGLQLVLVDDNPDVRETVALLLESLGYGVQVAASGEAGVQLIRQLRPDAALIDIGLDDLDGYTVARRVRALGDGAPFMIAMTGFGQEKDRVRSREAGFDAHLTKPATVEALVDVLQTVSPRPTGTLMGGAARSLDRASGDERDAVDQSQDS